MKQLLILLTVCLILAGCGPAPPPVELHPRFQRGDVVILKIAGHGQILNVLTAHNEVQYAVRVPTRLGPRIVMLCEFELDPYLQE